MIQFRAATTHGTGLNERALVPFIEWAVVILLFMSAIIGHAETDRANAVNRTVKIVGTSVRDSIEGFETGLSISSTGDVVTVATPLLESKNLRIVLSDNRSFPAKLLGTDTNRQVAYLRTTATDLPFFDLSEPASQPKVGDAVWATANRLDLMQEAKPVDSTKLTLLRIDEPKVGVESSDRQSVRYVVEGMPNRAGAFGGALTNESGQLIGMIAGPEHDHSTSTFNRRVIPTSEIRDAVASIMQGKRNDVARRSQADAPHHEERVDDSFRGIVLLPEVLDQTPAFIDEIKPNSPAAGAGLQPDDLILYVGPALIRSTNDFHAASATKPRASKLILVILRGDELKEVEFGEDEPSSTK